MATAPKSNAQLPKVHRTDWMGQGKFGLMVHWIAPGPAPEHGERVADLNAAVERFDLDRFMNDFQYSGADWLIFTIGQNTGFYASPNSVLDRYAGIGHASRRDLIKEIAQRVAVMRKRFIAYLPSEIKAPTELHRGFDWNKADQSEFQKRYCEFIREYALRFGRRLDGWWFDGCYTWEDFPSSKYNFPAWFAAARAGNPDAIVTFNDGCFCKGITRPVTPLCDYLSGEAEVLRDGKIKLGRGDDAKLYLPDARFVDGTECQWHALVPIDCAWFHGKPGPMETPKYPDAELFKFVKSCKAVRGAVTLNAGIYQEGHLGRDTLEQLRRLSRV